MIGLTATAEGPQHSSLAALIAVETAILAVGVGLVRISTRRAIEHRGEALLLATAAGVLFGVSDVAIKYLTHAHGPLLGLLSPWTLTAAISFVISFYASARSLQVAANLSAILGGILVFGEPIGSGAVGISVRLLAFCLVIAGAALVPAPLRAASDPPGPASGGQLNTVSCPGASVRASRSPSRPKLTDPAQGRSLFSSEPPPPRLWAAAKSIRPVVLAGTSGVFATIQKCRFQRWGLLPANCEMFSVGRPRRIVGCGTFSSRLPLRPPGLTCSVRSRDSCSSVTPSRLRSGRSEAPCSGRRLSC